MKVYILKDAIPQLLLLTLFPEYLSTRHRFSHTELEGNSGDTERHRETKTYK